jgi:hypothetical protein
MSSLINSRRFWFCLPAAGLLLLLLAVCSGDDPATTAPSGAQLSGSTVTADGCKTFVASVAADGSHSDQDCVEFSYDGSDVLHIKRINAAFNCCPDSFYIEADLDNRVITLTEKEDLTSGGCFCLCLYDLEYSVSGIAPDDYTIRVIEPYRPKTQGDPLLQFTVDLDDTPAGTFCVERHDYPWGSQTSLVGTVTLFDGCRPLPEPSERRTAAVQNCLSYVYDGAGSLIIDHTNAVFNCCADSSSVSVNLSGDTLFVEEHEHYVQQGPCRCFCPFDLSYVISVLTPGAYTLRVIGPEAPTYDDTLTCELDLTTASDGQCCVDGPW